VRIVLLGSPGAGKGTVAKLLSSGSGAVQISTGDILRRAVQAGTPLGRDARGYMDRGELVPDDLIMGIMEERLREPDCRKGFLLDGFPRTIPQAVALRELLGRLGIRLDLAVNMVVSRDIILDRLTTRRTCSNPGCQEIFNLKTRPPAEGARCTECGAPVVQRDDETVEAISRRLETYNEKSSPLVDFYAKAGLLFTTTSITKEESLKDITEALCQAPRSTR
jgi:adenylate kinase